METTRLSTKGQLILPKSVRDAKAWKAGMEFTVEATKEGVLLRPAKLFKPTRIEDVAGCLHYTGKPKTLAEMDQGIIDEVKRRHARGRY